MILKIKNFVSEVGVELKKVSWSSRTELVDATKIVLISVVVLGFFISLIDFVLSKALEFIIK